MRALLFHPTRFDRGILERRQKREARITELEKDIAATTDDQLAALSKKMLSQSAAYLGAAADYRNRPADKSKLSAAGFADALPDGQFRPLPALLQRWVDYLGFGDLKLMSRIAHDALDKPGLHTLHNADNADTPAGMVNITDKAIAFGTVTMPPFSVGIHPSPKAGVGAGWKSPSATTGTIAIKGRVADADPNCGDGIAWQLELQGDHGKTLLCSGDIPNGGAQAFSEGLERKAIFWRSKVVEGETLNLIVLPKADYACDFDGH